MESMMHASEQDIQDPPAEKTGPQQQIQQYI